MREMPGPLSGRRVLVTRPARQSRSLIETLEAAGAQVDTCATIETVPLEHNSERLGILNPADHDWFVFTSQTAVRFFFESIEPPPNHVPQDRVGRDRQTTTASRELPGPRIAAVGPATARALLDRGFTADLVPEESNAEALTRAMLKVLPSGTRVLFPRARGGRETLVEGLESAGMRLTLIELYESRPAIEFAGRLQSLIASAGLDVVTFLSPSAIDGFMALSAGQRVAPRLCGCIGDVTASRARFHGLQPLVTADPSSIDGLVKALVNHLSG